MEKGTITLKWEKFDSFKDLLEKISAGIYDVNKEFGPSDESDGSGVYLHTIINPDTNQEYVDYVGKVTRTNIIERQITHYRNIKGGIYGCASEVLAFFEKGYYKKEFSNEDYYSGLKGDKKKGFIGSDMTHCKKIFFNKDISMQLAPIFFEYANNTKVYLAAVGDTKRVEKKLIYQLQPIRNWTRYYKDNGCVINHEGAIDRTKIEELEKNNKDFGDEREKNKGKEHRFMKKY
jgi:hypothetical protein